MMGHDEVTETSCDKGEQKLGLFSAELSEQFGGTPDVITSKKKVNKKKGGSSSSSRERKAIDSEDTLKFAAHLSKSKRKKLAQIAHRKAKAARHEGVIASLVSTRLNDSERMLLQRAGRLGKSESKKEYLIRVVSSAQLGLKPTEEELNMALSHDNIMSVVDETLGLHPGKALEFVKHAASGRGGDNHTNVCGVNDGIEKRGREKRRRPCHLPTTAITSLSELQGAMTGTGTPIAEFLKLQPTPPPIRVKPPKLENNCSSSSIGSTSPPMGSSVIHQQQSYDDNGHPNEKIDVISTPEAERIVQADDEGSNDTTTTRSAVITTSPGRDTSCSSVTTVCSASPMTWAEKMNTGLMSLRQCPENTSIKSVAAAVEEKKAAATVGDNNLSHGFRHNKAKYVPIETPLTTPAAASAAEKRDVGVKKPSAVVRRCSAGQSWNVRRTGNIEKQRMSLPICGMEQEVVEAMRSSDIVILCGETGSGKSTQVPQFAYESGFASNGLIIGVTQPRRVAAMSTAERVAHEMNTQCGKGGKVAYQVRYDSSGVTSDTRIKFMTDGILLRELSSDILLKSYSVIILDEAHERSLNTDVLLGILSRSVPLRRKLADEQLKRYNDAETDDARRILTPPMHPLKVVIMSATLQTSELVENSILFPTPPPVVVIESRQHPVTIHFSKHTELLNYCRVMFNKVCQIHRQLPAGGVLVFLTGRQEILQFCRLLNREFNHSGNDNNCSDSDQALSTAAFAENQHRRDMQDLLFREVDDDEEDAEYMSDAGISVGGIGSDLFFQEEPQLPLKKESAAGPVHVLPLYAMLSPDEQSKVFVSPPEGHRLVVVATNVAETSITIPGIAYVVDCGRSKQRRMTGRSQVSAFEVDWISQSSADQRAGRAGRTGPGHCYRLYSSAVYERQFPKCNAADVEMQPLENVVLHMLAMGIPSISRFPFPTSPDPYLLRCAETTLRNLGALQSGERHNNNVNVNNVGLKKQFFDECWKLSPMGHAMALLPIGVRLSRMLVMAKKANVLEHAIAMVSLMEEQDPFSPSSRCGNAKRSEFCNPESDALTRMWVAGAYAFARLTGGIRGGTQFCEVHDLHEPTMARSFSLRKQITRVVNLSYGSSDSEWVPLTVRANMPLPSKKQVCGRSSKL